MANAIVSNHILDVPGANTINVPANPDWQVGLDSLGAVPGAQVNAQPQVAADQANPDVRVGLAGDLILRKLWVIEDRLNIINPTFGSDIPFKIWNPSDRLITFTAVSPTITGITFDLTGGTVFGPGISRTVNMQIADTAPTTLAQQFDFDFSLFDDAELFVNLAAAIFLEFPVESPILETWEFRNDLIASWNNTEQRLALRTVPRRKQEFTVLLQSDDDRRDMFEIIQDTFARNIIIPFYQYSSTINAVSTDSILQVDNTRCDIRAGESALVIRRSDNNAELVQIDSLNATSATLVSAMSFTPTIGDIVIPVATSFLNDETEIQMNSIAGEVRVRTLVPNQRAEFENPNVATSITTFDTFPVIDKRPLTRRSVNEELAGEIELLDNETGVPLQKTDWDHMFTKGTREFLIQRITDPADMDFWRQFVTDIQGNKAFLMPTWRSDLVLAFQPTPGGTGITITDQLYETRFFPFPTFQRIQLEGADGSVLYRRVVNVVVAGDNLSLTLDTTLPDPIPTFTKVSFLNLMVLDDDVIRLQHEQLVTTLSLTMRMVDA